MNEFEFLNSLGCDMYDTAEWYQHGRKGIPRTLRMAPVSDESRRFDPLVQSLVTTNTSRIIETRCLYDFENGQEIYYRKQWWQITNVVEKELDINPIAIELFGKNPNRSYLIEMIKVD